MLVWVRVSVCVRVCQFHSAFLQCILHLLKQIICYALTFLTCLHCSIPYSWHNILLEIWTEAILLQLPFHTIIVLAGYRHISKSTLPFVMPCGIVRTEDEWIQDYFNIQWKLSTVERRQMKKVAQNGLSDGWLVGCMHHASYLAKLNGCHCNRWTENYCCTMVAGVGVLCEGVLSEIHLCWLPSFFIQILCSKCIETKISKNHRKIPSKLRDFSCKQFTSFIFLS